jgi:hypothetical protein
MALIQWHGGRRRRPVFARVSEVALAACVLGSLSCASDDEQSDAGLNDAGGNDAGASSFCANVDDEVDELVRAAQTCDEDSDCEIASVTAPCLLLCGTVLSIDADADALQAALTSLSDAYQAQCEGLDGYGCAIANCVDPSTLRAQCTDGLCAIALSGSQP